MSTKLFKLWDATGKKKAATAGTLEELKLKACAKLDLQTDTIAVFLEDGTEVDEDDIVMALSAGTILYFLQENDKRPWESVTAVCNTSPPRITPEEVTSTKSPLNMAHSETKTVMLELMPWPREYRLPIEKFSNDLQAKLQRGDLDWNSKHELLGHISESVRSYTEKPSYIQRDIVARELVYQYPKLKSSFGDGHHLWIIKIYDRVREDISKLRLENGTPRTEKSNKRKDDININSARKRTVLWTPTQNNLPEESIEQHKLYMVEQMKKIDRDRDQPGILIKMQATFNDRRSLIDNNTYLRELRVIYPALFTVSGVENEFHLLMSIHVHSTFMKNLNFCSAKIQQLAEKKKKFSERGTQFLKDYIDIQKKHYHINNALVLCVCLIPHLLREDEKFLFNEYPQETNLEDLKIGPNTPHVAVVGNIFESSECYVIAEQEILFDCHEFIEAMITVFALYYVCSIEYPKQAESTFRFLQIYIMQIKDTGIGNRKSLSKLNTLWEKMPKII